MQEFMWFAIGFIVGGGVVWAFRGWVARTKEKAVKTIQDRF